MNNSRDDAQKVRINDEIQAYELRVVGPDGENFGIMSRRDAIRKAADLNLDLIEISAKAVPPVAKIADYGKFTYELKKKQREVRAHSHITETKVAQVKIGTGERDKQLKVDRIHEWLLEGHRVKVDLFLWGRYKYMEASFLTERLERFLDLIAVPYKIAEKISKSPKGFSCTIERDKTKATPTQKELATIMQNRLKEMKKEKKELEIKESNI